MNKDLADLKPLIINTIAHIRRHMFTIIFVLAAGLYGFLIWQINVLNHREPNETAVIQGIEQVKRPNIDTQTADKLKALEDNSQDVKALFKTARENPFQE